MQQLVFYTGVGLFVGGTAILLGIGGFLASFGLSLIILAALSATFDK